MDRFVERCAGLDVHKDSVAVTVRSPGPGGQRLQETRTFSATTRGLLRLADWLASYGVTLVGMESTGCYWKPVYYALEERFGCWLLNAHTANLTRDTTTDPKTLPRAHQSAPRARHQTDVVFPPKRDS